MQITLTPPVAAPKTKLHFGKNFLQVPFLSSLCQSLGKKIAIVTDERLLFFTKELAEQLQATLITVPSGEKAKQQSVVHAVEEKLLQNGHGKDSILIAIGGGATTDLAGFVASIYMRGIALILVPTTLLAMVDAAIGGKTAIDTPFGKNLIGTIYHPNAVLIDFHFLQNLPEEQIQNGIAEIRKMGLIYQVDIWNQPYSEKLIIEAIKAKIAIVQQDATDEGIRKILNFGHTIGHGLEKISNYELSHGKAVAIGAVAAAHLSMSLKFLSKQEFESIQSYYENFFSLQLPSQYTRESLIKAISLDKKAIEQTPCFVLIDRIGHAMEFNGTYCKKVLIEELKPTLQWMEQWLCK